MNENISFPLSMSDFISHYLQKHEQFVTHIKQKIPEENIADIMSFCGTEYDKYYNKYDWEDIDDMLWALISLHERIEPVDMCEHLFKKFRKLESHISGFYPYASAHSSIGCVSTSTSLPKDWKTRTDQKICFNRFHWFYCVDGDRHGPPFWDDSCTDYKAILSMFMRILKHFDYWYWNHYTGSNKMETSLVDKIVDIYQTIEKFYDSYDKGGKEIDETFEKAKYYL